MKRFLFILIPFLFLACTSTKDENTDEKKIKLEYCADGNVMVDVDKSLSTMENLIGKQERIYMDKKLGEAVGVSIGQQVRIYSKDSTDKYGNFTIYGWYDDESGGSTIWMDSTGLSKFDQTESFDGCFKKEAVLYDMSASNLESNDEFGCFLNETNTSHSNIVVGSPHGGNIERYTDEQAVWFYDRIADYHQKDVSAWYCMGWHSVVGAFDAWHITSTDISRKSYLKLDQIGDRAFKYSVSFHGFEGSEFFVGGAAPTALKEEVKAAIESVVNGNYVVTVEEIGGTYAGTSVDNFVNWLTSDQSNGVQIEQPYTARGTYGKAIAEAVADLFAGKN